MKTKKFTSVFLMVLLLLCSCEKDELSTEVLAEKNLNLNAGALHHTKSFTADVPNAWFSLLADLSRDTPYFPPQSARLFSYTGLTLYEAVVPGMPSYQSVFTQISGEAVVFDGKKKDYYWPAAANAALARISTRLLGNFPQPADLDAIMQLEQELNEAFMDEVTEEQLERSNEFGVYVAELIHDWSLTDGTFAGCPPYILLGGPENWVPTPPGFFPVAGACQGSLRTFIPDIAELTMPVPPPSYSTDPSSEFYQMVREVYDQSFRLTPNDHVIIQAWRDLPLSNYNTPSHIVKLTSGILEGEEVNLEDASVIYAQQGMAMFDAIAANFSAKFGFALLRPITYIRNVMGHSDWNSVYPTPQHPSYPAVAPAAAAAGIVVLEKYFGTEYSFDDATQDALYGTWSYDSFAEIVADAGRSRTHSGLNFQFSVDIAIEHGRAVGEEINSLPFRKP